MARSAGAATSRGSKRRLPSQPEVAGQRSLATFFRPRLEANTAAETGTPTSFDPSLGNEVQDKIRDSADVEVARDEDKKENGGREKDEVKCESHPPQEQGTSPKRKVTDDLLGDYGESVSKVSRTLRERLALRCSGVDGVSEFTTDVGLSATSTTSVGPGFVVPSHSALGGLTLRWRLLLDQGAASAGGAKAPEAEAAENEMAIEAENVCAVTDAATPSRADTSTRRTRVMRKSKVTAEIEDSSAPAEMENSSAAANQSGEQPATPPPSLRSQASWQQTPTPPLSQSSRSASCKAASPPSDGSPGVKELKRFLQGHGIDIVGCVEKVDLQSRFDLFQGLSSTPLPELRKRCAAAGATPYDVFPADAEACARFLTNKQIRLEKAGGVVGGPAPEVSASVPRRTADGLPSSELSRGVVSALHRGASSGHVAAEDAEAAAQRILALRRQSFVTELGWGLAVLQAPCIAGAEGVAAVHRAHRGLMRLLHPDKAGSSPEVARAMEVAREARALCERALLRQEPPGRPSELVAEVVCAQPHGKRRVSLRWDAPRNCEDAPIKRYIVAAWDPGYGRAITVAVLEPDYSEEKRRFIPVEELQTCLLAEEDMQKMPRLFQQRSITLQVAAANEAGQSPWATTTVTL